MNGILVVVVMVGSLTGSALAHGVGVGEDRGPLMPRLLALTETQRAALGIEVAAVGIRQPVIQPALPARVILPNTGMRVVAARHAGIVARLDVALGDRVAPGQVLGFIESPAAVEAQRGFLDASSRHALVRAGAERERQLAAEGVVAGRRAAEAATELLAASARLDQRRQALVLLGYSAAAIADLVASRTIDPALPIQAPIAGGVLEQYVHPGQHVAAGDALYRIGDHDRLHLEVHVPIDLGRRVEPGDPVEVSGGRASGRVLAVAREVHDADQGVLVRAELDGVGGDLHPGEFVTVHLARSTDTAGAFHVPTRALVRAEGRAWVFVERDGGFEPVAVEVVGGRGDAVAVRGPLDPGTAVAVRGTAALKAYWAEGDDDDEDGE